MKSASCQSKPDKDYAYYAQQIKAEWNRAVGGILAMGYLLFEARMTLPPLEWKRLVLLECPFDLSVACRLIRISQDQRLTDSEVIKMLPPSWDKLYQLVTLPESAFRQGIAEGVIHPGISGREIERLRRESSQPEEAAAQRNPLEELQQRLIAVLNTFLFVDAITARISEPKPQVVEISRSEMTV